MDSLGDVSDGCDLAGERVDGRGTGCLLDEPVQRTDCPGAKSAQREARRLRAVDDPHASASPSPSATIEPYRYVW